MVNLYPTAGGFGQKMRNSIHLTINAKGIPLGQITNNQSLDMRLIDVYPYRTKADKHEFLILKRSAYKQYAGQWRMIGGKIEAGEIAWEAGLRELKEETSLVPDLYWAIPSLNHFYNHRNNEAELIPAFAAQLPYESDIMLNEEHMEYKWIESHEVDKFVVWPEQRRLITLANTILSAQKILEDWKISF